MSPNATVDLEISDVSKQKLLRLRDVPSDSTVGELVQDVLEDLQLKSNDSSGRSLAYQALLDREHRHLHATETVGEALRPGDHLILTPEISAGLSRLFLVETLNA